MAYLGNTVTTQGFIPAIDYFNGDGTTTAFTLSRPVASVAQVQVVVNNVPQLPGTAYTVSSNTITFTGAPSSGTSNIYVYYTSPITQVIQPSQGTVGTTQLVDANVTIAKLSATGTPSSSTYLRGDNTWASVSQKLAQYVVTQLSTRTTGSTTWSSVPPTTISTTTGSKFLEASITPLSASNTIVVIAYCSVAAENANHSDYLGCGIWKNNTGSPLVANYWLNTNGTWVTCDGANSGTQEMIQIFTESAGSTTARTYSWYCGVNGGTIAVNGAGSGSFYSGSNSSSLIVFELA